MEGCVFVPRNERSDRSHTSAAHGRVWGRAQGMTDTMKPKRIESQPKHGPALEAASLFRLQDVAIEQRSARDDRSALCHNRRN